MSKLEECILGDLVEFQRGYDLPKSKFVEGKYPVQSSNGILGYHNEYKVEGPGITIGRSGTVGNPHLIRENFFPHNTSLFVKEFKGNDIEYIYYLLQYLDLGNQKSGSGVPTMNRNHLHPIKIRAYRDKICQQRAIKILSLIDKKIKTNNQINKELEAMAKTIYDYWFVQFDFPDQNGKPYKSSGGKMVYHPELKREIPEGWGVEKIENIAQTGSGGTPKSTIVSYYSNGEIPWINSGELEQTVITSTSNFITEEGLNNSSAKLFPSGTILVAMYGATAGKVSFLTFEAATNQAICAIMLTDIRMRYYLKNVIEDLYQYLVKLSTGSARDNLSQDMIKNIKVVIPSNDIIDRFYDFSNNIIKEITKKQQENEQLTQLRDWLLPMLMNGQVKA
ncbi:restriction endonuclease subunit S [Streptococcus australis]|uniref:restriction endonuclease subunit S n=1 Tax=Streptococcus australis TaxID=113107 RepID=UPI00232FD541|nr:restriction endonuclease subunit S [Streptococcus australis]MDB8643059.1 restriction endonuclease subunit S [Streptococcus australis]MDB8646480.1 restriction endonuclease subunit S [Streptococcus australis]